MKKLKGNRWQLREAIKATLATKITGYCPIYECKLDRLLTHNYKLNHLAMIQKAIDLCN